MPFKRVRKYYRLFKRLHEMEEKGSEIIELHELPLRWLHEKLTPPQFLVLSGILVGCTAGLAGVALKAFVHYIQKIIFQQSYSFTLFPYVFFPIIGIVLTVLVVQYVFKGKDGKGIPKVLFEIAHKSSFVHFSKTYTQLIQSGITVSLGGSGGLESPIAVTGAAIGSNYARIYRMSLKNRTLLLAAGSAAGIAAAFDAPIAGVMFALEMILTGVVFSDFIPLVIASVCGAIMAKTILGDDILLHFDVKEAFNYSDLLLYVALGIFLGLYSRYYAVMVDKIDTFLKQYFKHWLSKALFAGAVLSLLCFLFPPLFGEGYTSIKQLVDSGGAILVKNSVFGGGMSNSWMIIAFVGLVGIFKVFATTFTIAGGGNGGNFAPSIVAGAFAGCFFALVCQAIGFENVPIADFTVVGMAGAVSGILYAPLTGIFLIAEATGGYSLFIPLMIVASTSYLIVRRFSPYSINNVKLVKTGRIFGRKTDHNLLSLLKSKDIIEQDIALITPEATLRDLVELVKSNHRNMYGVVTKDKELEGVVMLDDIREIMFKEKLYDSTLVRELMKKPPAIIDVKEDMESILQKFDETQSWNLPMVNGDRFLGFISKSTLLQDYREVLIDYSMQDE